MKIKSHFSDLKSAIEAVRKLKSEGIKSAYVDANEFKGNNGNGNHPYESNIEKGFTNLVVDSGENIDLTTSPLSLTNAVGSNINADNNGKISNIFVVIDSEDENFNEVKKIVEGMGGVVE